MVNGVCLLQRQRKQGAVLPFKMRVREKKGKREEESVSKKIGVEIYIQWKSADWGDRGGGVTKLNPLFFFGRCLIDKAVRFTL